AKRLVPDEDGDIFYDASADCSTPCPRMKKIFDTAQKKAVDLTATVISGEGTSPIERAAQTALEATTRKALESTGLDKVVHTPEYGTLKDILANELPDKMPRAVPPPPATPVLERE